MSKNLVDLVFDKYDSDKSGTINRAEFRFMCNDLGYTLNDRQIDAAWGIVDRVSSSHSLKKNLNKRVQDGAGNLSRDEFKKWWKSQDRLVISSAILPT